MCCLMKTIQKLIFLTDFNEGIFLDKTSNGNWVKKKGTNFWRLIL